MKKWKIPLIILLVLVVLLVLVYVVGSILISRYLKNDEAKKLEAPGNAAQYSLENTPVDENSPLQGKRILFLGSSVTRGSAALTESFADYLGKRDGVIVDKEAVSATTLVDEFSIVAWAIGDNGDSYVTRLKRVDRSTAYDAVVVQLSTNDATNEKELGVISEGFDPAGFDTKTVTGAIEYIIWYIRDTWDCPVIFYTGSYYESDAYAAMVDRLLELQEKWGIEVIDLYTDEAFNDIDAETYQLYMYDEVHPTRAGYREWWLPAFEAKLTQVFG